MDTVDSKAKLNPFIFKVNKDVSWAPWPHLGIFLHSASDSV